MESIEPQWMDGLSLEIPIQHTERFIETAKTLGEFIKALPLSNADNDQLIKLIIDQIEEAEKAAFETGFHMGGEFAQYQQEDEETE